ncbi:uncharacterized protein HGUI_01770 [Hanseniaspora guilliermondii]|uniref:Uncharacterized protein n=1 Tax=Hanseniaspora guilliermondii TaxID=56406 RepID=A0A1L0AZL0_9ASCO|nr:uncharacterized protein HGUI_01770 [Hanseniaspora guilliermondii]
MNFTNLENEPFVDNELDDINKDIDTKIDFLHEKVIKDLIRVRLFQNKKALLEQYSINDENVSMNNQVENNDDIEIKQLSDKNMELEQLIDSKKDQLDLTQRTQESIVNDLQNTITDLKNNCKRYDEYIESLKNELLTNKYNEKKKLMNDNKAEHDTLNSKNELISKILQLRIEIIQNNIIFQFKNKYSVKLTKDENNLNKITDWNSKSYKLSISDRNKLEKEFNNMDLKSWIINVREMLIQ